MNAHYYLLAIGAGLGITLQTTLNGQLAKGVGGDSLRAYHQAEKFARMPLASAHAQANAQQIG